MKRFWPHRHAVGTKLVTSLVTRDGKLLLAKGSVLTDSYLDLLHHLDAYWDDESRKKTAPKIISDPPPEQFRREYKEAVKVVNDFFSSAQLVKEHAARQLVESSIRPMVESRGVIVHLNNLWHRDAYTLHHSVNVSVLAGVLAKWLHYSEADLKDIMLAGLLHDIGKSQIPLAVLNKPGPLTAQEKQIMLQHPVKGYQMLQHRRFPDKVLQGVRQHHEKMDGSGYPDHLTGQDIHPFAKIIAVADIYDAMTSDRVYHKAKSPYEVAAILYREMFGLLDPFICAVFLRNLKGWIIGSTVALSDGREAQVVSLGQFYYGLPIVRTLDGQFINLEEDSSVTIISE